MAQRANAYTLGLDLGSASVGWALLDRGGKMLVDCGVRVFDPGVDPNKFMKGEEGSSKNVQRRMARLQRRQIRRRAARARDLFRALQDAGLLPGTACDSAGRHASLEQLDQELRARWRTKLRAISADHRFEQVLPYLMRGRALDERLELDELGRVLYQLGQRRGFKSNRKEGRSLKAKAEEEGKKATKKDAGDKSQVKAEIANLAREIETSRARTLGEYFAGRDPTEARIRDRWTGRKMYEEEFEKIWARQSEFHASVLTAEFRERVRRLLFFQRPIAMNAGAIGECELERGEKRAPVASLEAQRFRLLQKVNDLKYVTADFAEHDLTAEQRQKLAQELENKGDLTFAAIRKLLGLAKEVRLNLERGGERKLRGNRTAATMLKAFGYRWAAIEERERQRVVGKWMRTESEEEMRQVAELKFELTPEQAMVLADTEPEDGYSRLSLKALRKILPRMEEGVPFKTAETDVYGNRFSGGEAKDFLPPVEDVLPQIPNPAVKRALTELKKVVNAIVRKHGKPQETRIELARDLKSNAEQRYLAWKGMREQEKRREGAAAAITKETGMTEPKSKDKEMALLHGECGGICVYCGRSLGTLAALFNGDGGVQVEHILPKSRFPDDSFGNKTLACRECNALKHSRTPFEAFGGDEESWKALLERVRKLKNRAKLERFELKSADEMKAFTARRLQDTRYVSKLAARYVGELYGGRDVQGNGETRRAVYSSSGMVTATLRRAWGLEAILREGGAPAPDGSKGKPRTDHRHHAVDAVVIALSSPGIIQELSRASAQGPTGNARISGKSLQPPWVDFVEKVRPQILGIHVSHRLEHKLHGPLHEETNYSKVRSDGTAHVRKPVHLLSSKGTVSQAQLAAIVDPKVRAAVAAKLAEVGNNAKKLENNWPYLVAKSGARIPIRRVRLRVKEKPQPIGSGTRERQVVTGGNHHIALFATEKRGKDRWEGMVVSRLDAVERLRRKKPVIEKFLPDSPDWKFQFSLMGGDMVEMWDEKRKERNLLVVHGISEGDLVFARHTDARPITDLKKTNEWVRLRTEDQLRIWGCRKVEVGPLGEVNPVGD
jgi:CRISPR-associated endonuclease Csn1